METLIAAIVLGTATAIYNVGSLVFHAIQNRKARRQGKAIALTQAQQSAIISQVQADVQSIARAVAPANIASLEQEITDTFNALKAEPLASNLEKLTNLVIQHKTSLLGNINFSTIEEYAQKAAAITQQCDMILTGAKSIMTLPPQSQIEKK
jgi:hypothetical protein